MKNKVRDLFSKYLKEYLTKNYSKSSQAYSNSLIRKTIGGRNYFLSKKEKERLRKERERKRRNFLRKKRKNETTKEYWPRSRSGNNWWESIADIRRRWIYIWENEMTEAQKIQFMNWFLKKIAIQKANGKKQWTAFQGLAYLYKRMEFLSNTYFAKGNLNPLQWQFVKEMSEFFGDILTGRSLVGLSPSEKKEELLGWKYPNKPSSWLIKFRYEGERGKDKKGILRVIMKRGKIAYPFFNFPYTLYVMLTYLTTSLGKYWWEQWLWRFSDNPNKYSKFAYKGNQEKLNKFIEGR